MNGPYNTPWRLGEEEAYCASSGELLGIEIYDANDVRVGFIDTHDAPVLGKQYAEFIVQAVNAKAKAAKRMRLTDHSVG